MEKLLVEFFWRVFLVGFINLFRHCHSPWGGEDPRKTHVGPAYSQCPDPPAEGTTEGEVQREPAGQERIPAAGQGLGQELF